MLGRNTRSVILSLWASTLTVYNSGFPLFFSTLGSTDALIVLNYFKQKHYRMRLHLLRLCFFIYCLWVKYLRILCIYIDTFIHSNYPFAHSKLVILVFSSFSCLICGKPTSHPHVTETIFLWICDS